ncbi:voltage-dependent anion channel [Amylocarpus encephaloides]|uniref:Voltage-dependent anion channel n=1 Tax=Amylocarpus encephaloides TaxID=45428 RepID=A0A9P8C9R7_9HELO|nr:voltage-dependent anion channel [Amylocarpus encephaloides]
MASSAVERTRSRRTRRYSSNSLEGQRGTLRTTKESLHGDMSIRNRIHHFTWAWFAMTMSTGGISLLLSKTPHKFQGLMTIGQIIFILDIVCFLVFTSIITTRFILFRHTLKSSLSHPTESLFFPTFWISTVNILSNTQAYGVPKCGYWLVVVLRVMFWLYTALAFIVAVGQYFFLFSGKPLTPQSAMPAWILPVFPIMLSGTLASVIGPTQPHQYALPILIAGVTFQGLGILMATYMISIFMGRLMTAGLPRSNMRPSMFIAVGPPSFTGLALIGISEALAEIYPAHYSIKGIHDQEIITDVFQILALSTAVFLWATAFWFFAISLVSTIHGIHTEGMSFHMAWWAFVFPNVGFTLCTISIGSALESEGVLWVTTGMTILLVATWLFVGVMHARAVLKKQILWPGKDEDHEV